MNRPGKGCLSPSRYFPSFQSKELKEREIDLESRLRQTANVSKDLRV